MRHDIRRTTWSVLPAALEKAGRLAFPECKSPRTVPNEQWAELITAYETWHHILCSEGFEKQSIDDYQVKLNDIALRIAGKA